MAALTRTGQDYLMAIYRLHRDKHYARVKEVADTLQVKKPSVVMQIHKLREEGLVDQSPYGRIELTEQGLDVARVLFRRNRVIFRFLNGVLGVDAAAAEQDACGIEHELHPETMRRFLKFMQGLNHDLDVELDDDVEPSPFTLNDLAVGNCAEVRRLSGDDAMRVGLLALGLEPGERVRVVNATALGATLDVFVKGGLCSLRREQADSVLLDKSSAREQGHHAHCLLVEGPDGKLVPAADHFHG
jgi:DtxR family Mn-dependent transcriptional regulator